MPAARIDGQHVHTRRNRLIEDDFREICRVAGDPSLRHTLVTVVCPPLKPHALIFLGGVHGNFMRGSMCFSPLVPVLSSLSACQMPSKPCAQLDFAAIIANISRPINSYQAANNPRLGGKTVAYTSGAKCVHWWREALTLVERSPYTRRRASFGDVLLADACGRATIRPVLHTAPYHGKRHIASPNGRDKRGTPLRRRNGRDARCPSVFNGQDARCPSAAVAGRPPYRLASG